MRVDINKRSKTTPRSPVKQDNREIEEIEELKGMMVGLMKTMNEMRGQIKGNHLDLKEEVSKNTISIEELKIDFEEKEKTWQEEKEEMNKEIQL